MQPLTAALAAHWPEPVEVLNPGGSSPIVLVCEHASNFMPEEYRNLGLGPDEVASHIAWDIGAADLTRELSRLLDAPAFLGTYSRLLIDLNRPIHVAGAMPTQSEAVEIPGNRDIPPEDALRRVRSIFNPFHACIQAHIDERQMTGRSTTVISIHSFTPKFLDKSRPWHAGVLFSRSVELGGRIADALAADPALNVGRNVPYQIDAESDYAVLVHGEARGLASVLIEVRNDQLATQDGVRDWAARLAAAFTSI